MKCRLLEKWQAKECLLNKKIQELENQLEEEWSARKELELLIEKKAFSIETVKDNDKLLRFYTGFENHEVFPMVLDFLGRETVAHLARREFFGPNPGKATGSSNASAVDSN